jgi:hypothetical protein
VLHNSINVDGTYTTTGYFSGGCLLVNGDAITSVDIRNNVFNSQSVEQTFTPTALQQLTRRGPSAPKQSPATQSLLDLPSYATAFWSLGTNRGYSTLAQWQAFHRSPCRVRQIRCLAAGKFGATRRFACCQCGCQSVIRTDFFGTVRNELTTAIGAFKAVYDARPCRRQRRGSRYELWLFRGFRQLEPQATD